MVQATWNIGILILEPGYCPLQLPLLPWRWHCWRRRVGGVLAFAVHEGQFGDRDGFRNINCFIDETFLGEIFG